MKPFRFTLAALLMLRQREEQSALEAYALALRDHAAAAKRHETAESELSAAWQEWRVRLAGGCPVEEILRHRSHCERLTQAVLQCLADLSAAQSRLDEALRAVLAARQRREGMDKLKSRQRRAWEYLASREEQKQLDELAGLRANAAALLPAGHTAT